MTTPETPSSTGTALASSYRWRRLLFDYGPPVLLMVFIFCASTDVGSSAHSRQLVMRILAWIGLAHRFTAPQLDTLNHLARKAGHLTEYAILAGLLHRAMRRGGPGWALGQVMTVLAVTAFYAATDEFHQMFVPSRGASVWDVMLDTAGASLGLGIKWLAERPWKRLSSG